MTVVMSVGKNFPMIKNIRVNIQTKTKKNNGLSIIDEVIEEEEEEEKTDENKVYLESLLKDFDNNVRRLSRIFLREK